MAFLVLEGALGYDALALADFFGPIIDHRGFRSTLLRLFWLVYPSPHSISAQTTVLGWPQEFFDCNASVRHCTSTPDVHYQNERPI